jgi:hypothetical protein
LGRLLRGADAVAPVVGVGEAAAGPAQDGSLDGAHGVDEGLADAVVVGDLGVFADPDAVVDDAAEMLDEVGVELGGDDADGLIWKDFNVGVGFGGRGGEKASVRQNDAGGGECGAFEEAAAAV